MYILIMVIAFTHGSTGLASITAEFSSKAACEDAMKAVDSSLVLNARMVSKSCNSKHALK